MKERLLTVIKNAYAPYSKYKVASAVVTSDNHVFMGVNVENASYGATICAERNAINNAISHGYKKGDMKKLYVMVESDKLAFPCFLCRQTINEFFDLNDSLILMNLVSGKEYKMSDILNNPFGQDDLI